MAFPSTVGTPAKASFNANTTAAMDASGYSAGDALIAIVAQDGNTQTLSTTSSGWVKLLQVQRSSCTAAWFYKKNAAGPGSDTLTVTSTLAERGTVIVQPITGQDNSIDAYISAGANGTGGPGDPDNLAPGVGAMDFLWIASEGQEPGNVNPTAGPTNYSGLVVQGTQNSSCNSVMAFRQLNASSEDPGAFPDGGTGNWVAVTIAIRPPTPKQTSVARLSLASGQTPETQTAHKIKVRARTTAGGGTIRAALYEGATNRSGDLESSALTSSLADYTLAISDANAANITDYSNLEIRIWGYAANGAALVFEVDQVWLEIPASAGAISKTGGIKSGLAAGGARATNYSKTNGIVSSQARLGGAKAATFARAGGISTVGRLGGGGGILFSKTGGIVSVARLGGVRTVVHSKTNGISSTGILGGGRTVQTAKTGGISSVARLGGARTTVYSKTNGIASAAKLGGGGQAVILFSKSGGIVSVANLGGTRTTQYSKTNGIASAAKVGGARTTTYNKTNGIISAAKLGGGQLSGIIFTKTGGFVSVARLGGGRTATFLKSGGILAVGILGGSQASAGTISKTGGIRSTGALGASRSVLAAKAGGTSSSARLGGTRAYSVSRTGGFASTLKLGGPKTLIQTRSGGISTILVLGGTGINATPHKTGGISSTLSLGATYTLSGVIHPGDDHSLLGVREPAILVGARRNGEIVKADEEPKLIGARVA